MIKVCRHCPVLVPIDSETRNCTFAFRFRVIGSLYVVEVVMDGLTADRNRFLTLFRLLIGLLSYGE